jgi:two-component system nitrate/nitrite response regulator NarL
VESLEALTDASRHEVAVCIATERLREEVLAILADAGELSVVLSVPELSARLHRGFPGMAVIDVQVLDVLLVDPVLHVPQVPWTTSLLLLVAGHSRHRLRRSLRAGVGALLLEDCLETLPAVLVVARAGHLCVPSLLRQPLSRPVLSQRERQTLALAIGGLTNAEIATRLFVAPSTVKTHLSAAFQKLGVGSRAEAAALVHDPEEGLTELILGSALLPQMSVPGPSAHSTRYRAAGTTA